MEDADLQRELKYLSEELGYLKTFSRRLLTVLKLQLKLSDTDLDVLMRQAEGAQNRLDERPGEHPAPPCLFCGRPLQEGLQACIYCGRAAG